MRFLDTTTLSFAEIPDSELSLQKNQYAILSHRWGADKDEVTYSDILLYSTQNIFARMNPFGTLAAISRKKGWEKIRGFCRVACLAGYRYGWVDTCCIDKTNSSELSEAINSMYFWYSKSTICIAYLEDVPRRQLTDSGWFDRGWTLQELIAPKEVNFYDENWTTLGNKAELSTELSRKTQIPEDVLSHVAKPSSCSVAQRMSWAATRITKRIEDRAYSLMGLFEINMPMLYGERENAFRRLQQEIIRRSKDESVFAWAMGLPDSTARAYSGTYAPSPSAYKDCGDIVQISGSKGFSEVQGEVSISLKVFPHTPGTCLAELYCSRGKIPVAIVIAKTSNEGEYVRVRDQAGESLTASRSFTNALPWDLDDAHREYYKGHIHSIRFPVDPPSEPPTPIFFGFWLRTLEPPGHAENEITILSNCQTSRGDLIRQETLSQGNTGVVRLNPKNSLNQSTWADIRWLKFGFESYGDCLIPVLWIANETHSERLNASFDQAITSEQSIQSLAHKETMGKDLLRHCRLHWISGINYGWPEGKGVLKFGYEGYHTVQAIDIPKLNLTISMRLIPFDSSMATSSEGVDRNRLPLRPMMILVVDITEIAEKAEIIEKKSG